MTKCRASIASRGSEILFQLPLRTPWICTFIEHRSNQATITRQQKSDTLGPQPAGKFVISGTDPRD